MDGLPYSVQMLVEIVTLLIFWISSSGPAAFPTHNPRDENSEIIDWLTRYGYLPPQDPVTGQLQTWESVTNAIRSMQRFAGIETTGIMDEATLNLTQTPRCSLPDVQPTKSARTSRNVGSVWNKKNISWKIRTYPKDLSLDRETIRALMFYGLKMWSEVSPLQFHEVLGEQADIVIGFPTAEHGDSYPFDGRGGMVGHAFLPGEHNMAGSVHFDGEETWTFRSPADRGTDLFAVAVHEFGHALGLSHSASKNSIMRPYYQGPVGDPLKYRLQADDRSEIERLYGSRESPDYTGLEHGMEPSQLPSLPEAPGRGPSIRPGDQGPDRCRTSFDATAQIRGETFFFKGRFFWRLTHSGHLASLRPARISRFWRGLPDNLNRVDAVYERAADHKIVFFTGSQYWVFNDNRVEEGYPKPIADFGLPAGGIDAAFTWPQEEKTYFLKDGLVWRYDEAARSLDPGYPSETWPWRDLPQTIDDGMSWSDGGVYFFSGRECWRYAGDDHVLSSGYPRPVGQRWMGCEETAVGEDLAAETGDPEAGTSRRNDGAGSEEEPCICGSGTRAGAWSSLYYGLVLRLLLVALVQGLPVATLA